MSKIISIATAVPRYAHQQNDLFHFAAKQYASDESEKRKLGFLYRQSAINFRYSVIPDFSSAGDEDPVRFFSDRDSLPPVLEKRMEWYQMHAPALAVNAIEPCLKSYCTPNDITHLITVSCTGLSAPGLDLQLMEWLSLPDTVNRSSVNFMGCYAAIHALKLADAFCKTDTQARVLLVCVELCTLHFQHNATIDNITASLLFGDGAAALLVTADQAFPTVKGIQLKGFYAKVVHAGKHEMTWNLSSQGFLMTLSSEIPDLIKKDIHELLSAALAAQNKNIAAVTDWCIHPGGRKIVEGIAQALSIPHEKLLNSYAVLQEYGNMSSPTILFVLKRILDAYRLSPPEKEALIFGSAFGPGLTMETFTAGYA